MCLMGRCVFLIFCLLSCYIHEAFAKEEVMDYDEDYYNRKLKEDKNKISELLFNKPENIYLKKSNSDLIKTLQEQFLTHLVNNYTLLDFIPFFNPGFKDYFENRKYEFDKEKYSNIPKSEITNEIMRFFFKSLFSDDNAYNLDNDIFYDSLYYDLCQANSDLRLFDENGGVVECLLGEENKDNVVLKYLLSQAIMNATNKHNLNDKHELLSALMQEGDMFDNVYKTFLDLTQYVSLFRLFEPGDMFNKFGLPSDIFSSLLHGIREYEFFTYGKSYFDEESMEYVTEEIVFTNDGVKNIKVYKYNFLDNLNPLIWIGKYIGNKTFIRLLKKYFLKCFFTLIVLTPIVMRNIEVIKYYVSYVIKIEIEGFWRHVALLVSATVLTHLLLYNISYVMITVEMIAKCIFWYPVKYIILKPIRKIFKLTEQTTTVFIICVYLFLLFLLYHFLNFTDEDLLQCLIDLFSKKNNEEDVLKIRARLIYMFLGLDDQSCNDLLRSLDAPENIASYINNLGKYLGIFHRFCLTLVKFLTWFPKMEDTSFLIFSFSAFIRYNSFVVTIYCLFLFLCFFIVYPFIDYSGFQDYPYLFIYDLFYRDVVKVEQLDCMYKKKCIIENFINTIKSFCEKCEKSDTLSSILSENFKYKNNFMTTLDLWHKREYEQIKYDYSKCGIDNFTAVIDNDNEVIDNDNEGIDNDTAFNHKAWLNKNKYIDITRISDSSIGNMFRYLDKCNSFDIGENIYEKYTISEIEDFLNDYIMFFYYFISCYKFFKSAIKDIYKLGIYLYPVYLAKHRGFCLANCRQGGEKGQLSLEVKDSKNIFLGPECVPNNIIFDSNCQNIIFNGTNGAGKTIFLSQAALNVILAQSLGVAYAKSYDGDIIDKVVTSFSVGIGIDVVNSKLMQEYNNMYRMYLFTNKNGKRRRLLFVLDELCSGTDPESGEKIVKEFLVNLMQLGGNVIAATHYKSIRKIANITGLGCRNYTFNAYHGDDGDVIYDHKIKIGVQDISFAMAIMKNMLTNKQINKDFYDIFAK